MRAGHDHGRNDGHDHAHGHRQNHAPASLNGAFAAAIGLNLAFVAVEVYFGWKIDSPIIGVAGVGIVVNTATALLFMRGRAKDMNIRGAFLHMAADALVSLGVVLGGALYLWQGWAWIDPVMSLVIAAVIVFGTWSLFRQSLQLESPS